MRHFVAPVCGALALLALAAPCAPAEFIDLRVVDDDGSTMAEYRQYTSSTAIPSHTDAACFGADNAGSGERTRVEGASLIGGLVDAASHDDNLNPLKITDAFNDTLGPGLCGINGDQGNGSSYWNVRSNQADAFHLAEDPVANGDSVMFRQVEFPPGNELVLEGPARTVPGASIELVATSYDSEGTPSPAVGATVPGGDAPAGANGEITVTATGPGMALRASLAGNTPSNQLDVCVRAPVSRCGAAEALVIFGERSRDRIRGRSGDDVIRSRGGRDRVNIRGGGRDRVNCGAGRDVVVLERGEGRDQIAANCEKVVRR